MKYEKKQNKEQDILIAAEEEFLTKGYDGARTTSIAQRAGVTHAMLHYYFRTKEQLFNRVVEQKFGMVAMTMASVIADTSLPIVDRIIHGAGAHFDIAAKDPKLPAFMIHEILSNPERSTMIREKVKWITLNVYQNLQAQLDMAASRGEIRKVDAVELMMDIISLNVFSILIYPFMSQVANEFLPSYEEFVAKRKAEIADTIRRKLLIL